MLASFYKRIAGIKDYSKFLPGQGGFLDRFDSFMMAAFWYSILYLLVPKMFSI
jgi:phosphatidate cytidylyltransferase